MDKQTPPAKTPDQEILDEIRGMIDSLPIDQKARVAGYVATLRVLLKADRQGAALAITLLGAEMAAAE